MADRKPRPRRSTASPSSYGPNGRTALARQGSTLLAEPPASERSRLETELSGLDKLELALPPAPTRLSRAWAAAWPKLAAFVLFLAVWQVAAWLKGKPWVLPGPGIVLPVFLRGVTDGSLFDAVRTTMFRAGFGFLVATVLGLALGLAVARNRILRAALGSMITGLQTMPTIAWLPFAVLMFKLSESAILFVVVLGAAPAIANGIIAGVDHTPPLLLRAGRVLGARGLAAYRHVVLPAALPGFVAGLKQGWAFAWRSLLAGELIVNFGSKSSLGVDLAYARELSDAAGLMAVMMAIFVIGVVVDSLVFGRLDRTVRRKWGLVGGTND